MSLFTKQKVRYKKHIYGYQRVGRRRDKLGDWA